MTDGIESTFDADKGDFVGRTDKQFTGMSYTKILYVMDVGFPGLLLEIAAESGCVHRKSGRQILQAYIFQIVVVQEREYFLYPVIEEYVDIFAEMRTA
jgi:hypothetical protein